MTDVTAREGASLSGQIFGLPFIWHAENSISSNKRLVSAPLAVQFFRGYIKGYDRHH
jgi:hypothetical protein